MSQLEVLWQNQTNVSVNKEAIISHLEKILRRTGMVDRVEVELTLVGDAEITKLKKQFLGREEATDVLSFPNPKTAGSNLIGSIAISINTATRQAQEAGISLLDELKSLSGHGLLHLLGYHHK